jgi:hypothetical protein
VAVKDSVTVASFLVKAGVLSLMLLGIGFSALAQNRATATTPHPDLGKAIVHIAPSFTPQSIADLVRKAGLVVEGIVDNAGESRLVQPADPASVETEFLVNVAGVLKGDTKPARIVVAQMGGVHGSLVVTPAEDAHMRQGERYILFLTRDDRPGLEQISGLPRFLVTGVWSGRFKIGDGRITLDERAPAGLKKHNGQPKSAFIDEIRRAVAERQ